MNRSGFSDDGDESFQNARWFYKANINRSLKGKRGQAFLRDLVASLDAMPIKVLIAGDLEHGGNVCAIGSVGLQRGVNMQKIDPRNAKSVAKNFGISEPMAREIASENDNEFSCIAIEETPEERWQRMREWAMTHLSSLTGSTSLAADPADEPTQ